MVFVPLDDIANLGEAFRKRFVMSWETFQMKHKDWIAEMGRGNCPIDRKWYDQSYMWDRMDATYPGLSMEEALSYLRKHSGRVFFLTEKDEIDFFQGRKTIDSIAEADANSLADQIESDWYESYRLAEQDMYSPNALPDDLYVFDSSMKWCVVFTHETVDWEAEKAGDMMKTAQSRYCIICEI